MMLSADLIAKCERSEPRRMLVRVRRISILRGPAVGRAPQDEVALRGSEAHPAASRPSASPLTRCMVHSSSGTAPTER